MDGYTLAVLGLKHGNGNRNEDYEARIFRNPKAIFAAKQALDEYLNNFRQQSDERDKAEKAKLKKEADSSSGF